MHEDLDRLMCELEAWRVRRASSLCSSHQIAAFHFIVVTEEKFKVYGLNGLFARESSLATHIRLREDLFALEWALRGLHLPDTEHMLIDKLRASFTATTARKAMKILEELSGYYHVRDLVVTTKKGGYILDSPSTSVFRFLDNPTWPGLSDVKSRLISERVSAERNVTHPVSLETFSLEQTVLKEDFPHDICGPSYSSRDFWSVWGYIWRISVDCIAKTSQVYSDGTYASTDETKELGILITKRKLINDVVKATGVTQRTVSTFLQWMLLNCRTPRKFTLFHCPFVELNEKFVLVPPHAVLMAHAPTIFLRQLTHNDKLLYDACSKSLEKRWLARLKDHITSADRIIRTGLKLRVGGVEVEFDLVEYDRSRSTLSIGEAKFTIRPDSPAEVDHTNEILAEGTEQLKRQKKVLSDGRDNLEALLALLGLRTDLSIDIAYFLLPVRFTGSDFLNIPSWIMPLPVEFCLRPQCKGRSLQAIWADYKEIWDSLGEKAESAKVERELEIAGVKIVYPVFEV